MSLFVGNHTNKIDRKGRVSVPASFRQVLAMKGSEMVVLNPHPKHPAIEGSGMDWLEDLAARLGQLPEYGEEREALQGLFADVAQAAPDAEGRVILPEALARHAGIGENAIFVGVGGKFEIWDPIRYAEHREAQKAMVRERNLTVPPMVRAPGAVA